MRVRLGHLIVAPWKFDVLETNVKNVSLKEIKFPRVWTETFLLLFFFCSPLNLLPYKYCHFDSSIFFKFEFLDRRKAAKTNKLNGKGKKEKEWREN